MCSNIRYKNRNIGVGTHLITVSKFGYDYKQWGIGDIYNARVEKVETYWKNFDHVYIECDSFYEGRALFDVPEIPILRLACLQNEKGVLILTKSSFNTVVEPFHPRLPIILADWNNYIRKGIILEMNNGLLKQIA